MHLQWQERNPLRRHPFSLLINLEWSKDAVQWHSWNGSLRPEGQLHRSALFLKSAVTNLAGLTSLTWFCSLNQQKPNLPRHIMQLSSCGPTNWIIITEGSEEAATPAQASKKGKRAQLFFRGRHLKYHRPRWDELPMQRPSRPSSCCRGGLPWC